MNVIEKLAKSAEVNHGLQLQPIHVKEIVTILQGMQMQIASDQGRSDALTRILAVTLNQLGGAIDIEPELFADAEHYAVNVDWDDEAEGAVIHATLTRSNLDVPEVQDNGGTASDSEADVVPVPDATGGREEDRREPDPDEA